MEAVERYPGRLDLSGVIPPAVLGVDVGQRVDPTTLCLVEIDHFREDRPLFVQRFLEDLPLGTKYPDVVNRIVEVIDNIRAQDQAAIRAAIFDQTGRLSGPAIDAAGVRSITCRLDITGIGVAVLDGLAEPLRRRNVRMEAMTFTHGDRLVQSNGEWRLGKGYLVSRLQVLLQSQRIELPEEDEKVAVLVDELLNYQIKIPTNGNEQYGAFKVGSHDDLVTALGLAVLQDGSPWRPPLTEEELQDFLLGDLGRPGAIHDPFETNVIEW